MIMGALPPSYIHFGLLFSWPPPHIFLRDAFSCLILCAGVFLWEHPACVSACFFYSMLDVSPRPPQKGKENQHLLGGGKARRMTLFYCGRVRGMQMLPPKFEFWTASPKALSYGNFYWFVLSQGKRTTATIPLRTCCESKLGCCVVQKEIRHTTSAVNWKTLLIRFAAKRLV